MLLSVQANLASLKINQADSVIIQCSNNKEIDIKFIKWQDDMSSKTKNIESLLSSENNSGSLRYEMFDCFNDIKKEIETKCQSKNQCKVKAKQPGSSKSACPYSLIIFVEYDCTNLSLNTEKSKINEDSALSDQKIHHHISKRQVSSMLFPIFNWSSCPNGAFVVKHICQSCRNFNDILAFATQAHWARLNNHWRLTDFTSVFIGNPGYYYSNPYCVFRNRASKFNCRNHGTTFNPDWSCYSPEKNYVIASHDRTTGHYDHKLDQ